MIFFWADLFLAAAFPPPRRADVDALAEAAWGLHPPTVELLTELALRLREPPGEPGRDGTAGRATTGDPP